MQCGGVNEWRTHVLGATALHVAIGDCRIIVMLYHRNVASAYMRIYIIYNRTSPCASDTSSRAHHICCPDTRSTWHTYTRQPRHLTRAADSLSTCAGTYHLVISDRTSLDRRSAHGTWPLGGGGQRRARCGTRIRRTRQHAHQPPATLVTDALAWRLTWHHLPPQCAQRLVHIAVPASRCHVAKCPIFVARGPGGLMLLSSSSILAHHQSPTAMHAATGPHRHP